jgi:hypothetical protein
MVKRSELHDPFSRIVVACLAPSAKSASHSRGLGTIKGGEKFFEKILKDLGS